MERESISAAVFDMDGTILDSSAMWDEAAPHVLRLFGYAPKPSLQHDVLPLGMREYAPFIRADYRMKETVEEIDQAVNEFIGQYYLHQAALKPGALDFLSALRREGVPLGVATATDRRFVEPALARTGALPLFDAIVTCAEAGAGKRSPAVYREAALRLGCEKSRTWIFEDSLHPIHTAKADGFPVCAVEDFASAEDREAIRAAADRYLTDFTRWREVFPLTEGSRRTGRGPRR